MIRADGSEVIRTLVIAPHMDDEVLGAGGLIRKRICCQQEVAVLTCFGRRPPVGIPPEEMIAYTRRQQEHFTAAQGLLGFKQFQHLGFGEGEPTRAAGYYELLRPIEQIMKDFAPTEVIIPGRTDLNQDHRFLNEVCLIALRAGNRKVGAPQTRPIKRVLEMVAHDVRGMPSKIDFAAVLTEKMIETVVKAMRCYTDEVRPDPHPRSVENIWARYRFFGAQFGFTYAEPYRTVFAVD